MMGAMLISQGLRSRIRNNPFYVKNLISSDERTLAVLVFLDEFEQKESLLQGREVTRQVRTITNRIVGSGQALVSGLPEMELQGTENMMRDLRVLTPLTMVLVVIILAASFRCLRGILLPLGMIGLAVVWTLAAMVWSGRPLESHDHDPPISSDLERNVLRNPFFGAVLPAASQSVR